MTRRGWSGRCESRGFAPEVIEVEREVHALRLRRGGARRGGRARGQVAGGRALVPLHRVPRGGRPHADARHLIVKARAGRDASRPPRSTESVKARALELGFDRVAIGPGRAARARRRRSAAGSRRAMPAPWAISSAVWRAPRARARPARRALGRLRGAQLLPGRAAPDPSWRAGGALRLGPRLPRRDGAAARARSPRIWPRPAGARSQGYVDTGPVLERDLAARAGPRLDRQEHHAAHPRLGSWFFIGVLLTTAELGLRRAARRPLRHLPRLPRRLPDRRLRRALRARRPALHLLPDDRAPRRHRPRSAAPGWPAGTSAATSARTSAPGTARRPLTREPAFEPPAPYPGAAAVSGMDDEALRRASRERPCFARSLRASAAMP